jgi:hypothetical protein
MRPRALLVIAALAASLLPAPLRSAAASRPPGWCAQTLSQIRSLIVDAERYPPVNQDNAYHRFRDLNDPIVGLSPSQMMGGVIGQQCGQRVELRLNLYDAWAAVLRDQAAAALLPDAARCKTSRDAMIRYQIANDATALINPAVNLGLGDPDVRHVGDLLRVWAAQHAVQLPRIGDSAKTEALLSRTSRAYDRDATNAPPGC